MQEFQGFVLTKHWRDTPQGVELEFWLASEQGPLRLLVPEQSSVFFLPNQQLDKARQLLSAFSDWQIKPVELRDFSLQPVSAVYFSSQRTLREARDVLLVNQLDPYESDIHPCDRFLMERYIRGGLRCLGQVESHSGVKTMRSGKVNAVDYQPMLKVVSLDIETAMQGIDLYSIAVYAVADGEIMERVFMRSDAPVADGVHVCADTRQLMLAFSAWLAEFDPDIIIGWNVVNFDLWYLEQVCKQLRIPFAIGRNNSTVHWRQLDDEGQRRAVSIPGRVALDGIEVLKAATYQFESFALNAVANEVLGDGKLLVGADRGDKITELFHQDKAALAKYNVQDCKLVWDIFNQLHLMDFAIARTRMTGLALDRIGGSVAAFDFRYLPLLHRQQHVAPNAHLLEEIEHSPGGFVMNSKPGIYQHVLVLDFKSLYPSIIRTFNIDPLALAIGLHTELDQSALVPGFKGAWFARGQAILPGLIEELWQLRDAAKKSNDKAQSQAIKILMNSFYGVMGAKGCRFFDARLASSITRRGHQIIQQTAEQIEAKGWSVIYGDTDSVFVWLEGVDSDVSAQAIGKQLQMELNQWWRKHLTGQYQIDSALELEFETHFKRFLMPTIRGSDQGSKKRYAGVVNKAGKDELVFKGLEVVRTDWTALARAFQAELYRRVFNDEPYRDFVLETVRAVQAGECDTQLVYRKRLRRKLADYQRNIPPQVQAARKAVALLGQTVHRGDWVEYVITVNGAEPVALMQREGASRLDYQHYIDRQLAPVADGILYFLDDSLAAITDQQYSLFN